VAFILLQTVDLVVGAIWIVVLVYSVMSFIPMDPLHPVRRTVTEIAEPILRPFRNLIPPLGMIDVSPIVALIVIRLLGELVKLMIRSAFQL